MTIQASYQSCCHGDPNHTQRENSITNLSHHFSASGAASTPELGTHCSAYFSAPSGPVYVYSQVLYCFSFLKHFTLNLSKLKMLFKKQSISSQLTNNTYLLIVSNIQAISKSLHCFSSLLHKRTNTVCTLWSSTNL